MLHARYRAAPRKDKGRLLDDRWRRPGPYGSAVMQALTAGYPWSVRLKALLPLWLPWARRRFGLSATEAQDPPSRASPEPS
jgi:hypothetical protein